jgi:hypothetical protein
VTSLAEIALGVGLVAAPLCAAGLILAPPRRVALLLLLVVFAGVAAVIGLGQQTRIGLGLLATGAVACAILGIGFHRTGRPRRSEMGGAAPGGRGFRAATMLLVATAAWGLAIPYTSTLDSLPASRLTAAVMVLAMGLLQLGLSQEQGAAAIGLLTALAGFELMYVGLEPSLALRAVLAGIILGIAVVSSVLLEEPGTAAEGRRAP